METIWLFGPHFGPKIRWGESPSPGSALVQYKNVATNCLGSIAFQWKSWRLEYIFSAVILVTNGYGKSWDSSCEKY